jgi:hypothetical protein
VNQGEKEKGAGSDAASPPASLLATSQLKQRGWTQGLITNFLGEPDALRPNPRYRSAAPMRLYALARVEAIEAEPAFGLARARAGLRSQRAKATAARKAEELTAQARSMPITVDRLPPDQLRRRAILAYNRWHETLSLERGYDHEPASESSDPSFLARITVNFVRHSLTAYDHSLASAAGKIGVQAAVAIIRQRVYQAIAAAYPDLADECQRQLSDRQGIAPPPADRDDPSPAPG